MRILAISGSLRANSTNTVLVRATVMLAPLNMEIIMYDGLADLPHFNPDLDGDHSPPSVKDLRGQLQAADGVLICTPEYAYGMPGALKNALDWTVSTGEFYEKPTAVISASPSSTGGEKAHASLLMTLTALAAEIVEGGTLIIPFVRTKLNATSEVSDPETAQALRSVLDALARAIKA
ncbi:MAG TPA: NADPH-dependent FMN reductase [Ktedonobacteraceae bacterium]|nr:NADPH-dependent FMN reductase [Ktedonobacteraceae bacterium]